MATRAPLSSRYLMVGTEARMPGKMREGEGEGEGEGERERGREGERFPR
jgi:hypothetical protein